MSPRPPDDDQTSLESLERRVSFLRRQNEELSLESNMLQNSTVVGMTQTGDLEAHLKRLGEAVLGMITILSNNSMIVVSDGLIVPEHISVQGLHPPGATAEAQEAKNQLDLEAIKLRREFEVIKSMHQRTILEKQDKDRHIENLTNQIKNQRDLLNKINDEQLKLRVDHQKTEEELKIVEERCNTYNTEKKNLEVTLNELTKSLQHEQKLRADILSEKSRAENEFKKIKETVSELQAKNLDLESWLAQESMRNSDLAIQIQGERIDMARLKAQRSRFTEITSDTQHKETKVKAIAQPDEYYDYSGPKADIMKKLSLDSLSKYFAFIDERIF